MRVFLSLAAATALTLTGCSGSSSDTAVDDVTVKACTASPTGGKPVAEGAIANATKKASTYAFRVKFLDASGNEVTQGTGAVAKVEAGATATFKTEGASSAKGPLTCKVENVSRTVAP